METTVCRSEMEKSCVGEDVHKENIGWDGRMKIFRLNGKAATVFTGVFSLFKISRANEGGM
ncbi:MAG: hypothetical protein NPIRA04_27440 [Nitrospirales bacterium]|nr:MAG: hypothetical protein NPIRA04_27440 [Nitrospirales bacterium]